MGMKHILPIITFLIINNLLSAQEQPLIAVMPLRSVGAITKDEANTVTNLLETGLVKSSMFRVVEKSEISEILAAQEYSFEEYIDENFAAQVGKLLSAEQIVIGTLARIGDKYFITAKIIDVATGRTLRADKAEADSIETIAGKAEMVGYRLAGVQMGENDEIKPKLRFGELLITTDPDHAEVLVNDIIKGISPLLVERIPLGLLRIAAKKNGMYGYRELELSQEELLKIKIVLNQRLGRLFLRISESNVKVKLDDDELGFLGDGIFPDIPEGDHSLEIIGDGLYAKKRIVIKPDETTTVNVELMPVGSLHYKAPEGAVVVISGQSYLRTFSGDVTIEHIPEGSYSIKISHPNYQTTEEVIDIERGKIVELSPELAPTPEYQARLNHKAKQQKQSELMLNKNILRQELERQTLSHKKLTTASRIFFGLGAGFTIGMGTTYILHHTDSKRAALWKVSGVSFSIAGAISLIVGTMLWLEKPNLEIIKEKIRNVEREIEQLDRGNYLLNP